MRLAVNPEPIDIIPICPTNTTIRKRVHILPATGNMSRPNSKRRHHAGHFKRLLSFTDAAKSPRYYDFEKGYTVFDALGADHIYEYLLTRSYQAMSFLMLHRRESDVASNIETQKGLMRMHRATEMCTSSSQPGDNPKQPIMTFRDFRVRFQAFPSIMTLKLTRRKGGKLILLETFNIRIGTLTSCRRAQPQTARALQSRHANSKNSNSFTVVHQLIQGTG
ncbi:hypothetical protein P153DRAFT_391397 [Dothidotthia symphoricarpi CBS 119687]|uniref:Uncharacterized protein n=1 Tax=Dothidotthia symphoricarpi CBS 119687 TaxID=1392245 RepID=A0A6A5ZW95_9PLEO|nr:uncharacterized protein P153DRAFT_391397 [Dothidotthia symphoricarpi CBS 119687]KAF2123566.1 hypothetical protein P153DRAFT_391397 [Dothidotthia symphoricarpi CBS 119687]